MRMGACSSLLCAYARTENEQVYEKRQAGLTVSLRRLEPLSSVSTDAAPLALRLLSIMAIIDRVA
jgi:hypothetical protein